MSGIHGYKGGKPKEAADTLRSTQRGEIVDLLGEGVIGGLVNGLKSVYLDGVPVENADGSRNFDEFAIHLAKGGPTDETEAHAFGEVQTEVAVGVTVDQAVPVVRTIADSSVDAVRVTITVPALQRTKGNGDTVGASFDWAIDVQSDGGGYVEVYAGTVSGKASSAYQRAVRIDLAAQGPAPWDVRVRRITADSTSSSLVDEFQWSSYTAISGVRMLYRHSAVARIGFDARYFNAVPGRAYDVLGISDWEIPSNYNPLTAAYTGIWNGTFVLGWTDNPAWVLHNLAKHRRYGLGEYLPMLPDKWELYRLAQWCDGLVPDGKGGVERRYTINDYIQQQSEALTLLQEICAIFRGALLYGSGTLGASWDEPGPVTDIWSPANVVDGLFNYAEGSWAAKKSSCTCYYNDMSLMGKRMPATWDDPDLIAKYGMRRMTISPRGISKPSMAIRMARWALYTTEMEDATVTFRAGAQGKAIRIGKVFAISDPSETGERLAGRVHSATTTAVTLDAPVTLASGETYKLWVTLQDPAAPDKLIAQERTVTNGPGTHTVLTVATAFSAAPMAQTTWLLEGTDVAPTLWRYIGVQEVKGDNGAVEYEITGLRHEPGKWDLIESNRPLQLKPTRRLADTAPKVATVSIEEEVYFLDGLARSRAVVSWPYPAAGLRYLVEWRLEEGPWTALSPTSANTVEVPGLSPGVFEVQVRSMNGLENVSAVQVASLTLEGDTEAPAAATGLSAEAVPGGMRNRWTRPTEEDYARAELKQGATYETAGLLFNGDGTEATWSPPANGTYKLWLRFYDRAGNGSTPASFDRSYTAVTSSGSAANSAPVYLYARTSTPVAPATPAVTLTYSFSSGTLSGGSLGAYSTDIPASGGAYLWITKAQAYGEGASDDILPGEWMSGRLLSQDGVSPGAGAMNADPGCERSSAWLFINAAVLGTTTAAGAVGTGVIRFAGGGLNAQAFSAESIPLNPARRYSLTARLAAAAGNDRNMYIAVRMFRADGSELTGSDTGWGGSLAGYAYGGTPTADGVFRQYGADFGAGTAAPIPSDACYCRVGIWGQYDGGGSTGTSSVLQQAQDVRLVDVTDVRSAAAAAAAAAGAALTAQNAADAANTALANIASDSLLTRGEKPQVILEYQVLAGEQTGIDAEATGYGITAEKTAYDSAQSALSSYLAGLSPAWNDLGSDTPIVGATFRSAFSTLYAARQTLLNKIAQVAGQRAAWTGLSGRPADVDLLNVFAPRSLGAMNADPACERSSVWELVNGAVLASTTTASAVGTGYIYFAPGGLNALAFTAENIALNPARRYRLSARLYVEPGNDRNMYIVVRMFRANGTELTGADTGWGGSYAGYVYGGLPTADAAFREYGADFGSGVIGRAIPADVAYCRVGVWGQYVTGSSSVVHAAQDLRLVDVTDVRDVAVVATAAASAASAAQGAADAANAALANIASDSLLTRGEKPSVILEYQVLAGEQTGIDAEATAYGITTEKTAYDSAQSALSSYLAGLSPAWNDLGSDTPIVGATFRSAFSTLYAARQALLNKIAEVARILANAAQSTANTKVRTFVQDTAPTAEGVGDLWLQPSAGNKLYRWTGSAWVALPLGTDAIAPGAATGFVAAEDQSATASWARPSVGFNTVSREVLWQISWTNTTGAPVQVECSVDVRAVRTSGAGSAYLVAMTGTAPVTSAALTDDGGMLTGSTPVSNGTEVRLTRSFSRTVAPGATQYLAAVTFITTGAGTTTAMSAPDIDMRIAAILR